MEAGILTETIRVMVVDDGAFMRRSLGKLLNSEPDIEVVGEAVNGRHAVERFDELRPDVVCLDIDMPEMDGLTAMKHIMSVRPTPIIIVSSMTDRNNIPFETLRLGVLDFFPKPSSVSGGLGEQVRHLLYVVRNSGRVRRENIRRISVTRGRGGLNGEASSPCRHLVAVAGTLGSVGGLIQLASQLPSGEKNGLAIVCKVPLQPALIESFLESFRDLLGFRAVKVETSGSLLAGTIHFVPLETCVRFDNGSLLVDGQASLPCLDTFLESAGDTYGEQSSLVLLAGDHAEGFEGLSAALGKGSRCFVQDESTALYRDWSPQVDEGVELFDLDRIVATVKERVVTGAAEAGA